MIDSLKNLANAIRSDIDKYHTRWYQIALELAAKLNVDEGKPRTCHRQINRSNIPADCTFDYYKRSITIPIVDHLNLELARRFKESSTNVYYGFYLIPSKLISFPSHSKPESAHWHPNPIALDGELELWETY